MNKSDNINEIATAFVNAQKVMRHATKDASNPFFKSKYADFGSVWDACRQALNEHGIAVSQFCETDGNNNVIVETMFMHTSGQWFANRLSMTPVKNDPQSVGSAITYARRYSLSAMACLATEEDDDGAKASGTVASAPQPTAQEPRLISPAQRTMFYTVCKGAGLEDSQIKILMQEEAGVVSTKELEVGAMNHILEIVRNPQKVAEFKIRLAKESV